MVNKLTIDLEEWFHAYFYNNLYGSNEKNNFIPRIIPQTELLLNLLEQANVKATFFIVGLIAESNPDLIYKIASLGHEIGSHSFSHIPVFQLNETSFKEDTEKSVQAIYNAIKTYTKIYRAPNFSINKNTKFAGKILSEYGFKYDSSFHKPTFHPDYGKDFGFPEEELKLFGITEIPVPTLKIANLNYPFAGGAYFRFHPYLITKRIIEKFNKNNESVVFYVHPWEFDSELPKSNLPTLNNIRTRYNISNNLKKLENLLSDFNFEPLTNNYK